MPTDLFYYQLLSLEASFIITFLLAKAKRSFLFLAALAVVLFILFGPFALPAFFLAIGFQAIARAKAREYGKSETLNFKENLKKNSKN